MLLSTLLVAGCALHNDVYISPLMVPLANVERGNDPGSMLRKSDYVHLVDFAPTVEARKHNAQELLAIGTAEVISGRYDAARQSRALSSTARSFQATAPLRAFRCPRAFPPPCG